MILSTLSTLIIISVATPSNAFRLAPLLPSPVHRVRNACVKSYMVGGRGWGNENFLESLGGDDEEREQDLDEYDAFRKSQAEFLERQEERMKDPKVREFMQARAQREIQEEQDMFGAMDQMDEEANDKRNVGFGGGTRFQEMMRKAQTLKERMEQQEQQQGFPFDQFGTINEDDEQ